MTDLETLMRETLTDDRRRLTVPHDPVRWVHGAVRQQRRRNALVGVAATTVVALAAAAFVIPMLTDVEATYVVGRPDAESGLLPWKPVGTLVEEPDVVASAVEAWKGLADDAPAGDVHLVAGERWDSTEVVVLQADTDSGAASIALLTTDADAAGAWELKDMATLPAESDVQAVVLPANTIPEGALPKGSGPGSPTSLVLGPEWRVSSMREFSPDVGSQLVAETAGFSEEPNWQPVERVSGYGWWAPLTLSEPDGIPPTTVVLDHTGHGYTDVAPMLDVAGSAGLSALTPSDVSFRLLPGEIAQPSDLDLVLDAAEHLDISGPLTVTMFSSGSGTWSMPNAEPASHRQVFAQIESNGIYTLVAYGTTDGQVTCLSHVRLDVDVASLPLVGMACPQPVPGSDGGYQAQELWARTFLPDGAQQPETVVVTIVQQGGRTRTERLSGSGDQFQLGVLRNRPAQPVLEYRFQAESEGGSPLLEPWVWPGTEVN